MSNEVGSIENAMHEFTKIACQAIHERDCCLREISQILEVPVPTTVGQLVRDVRHALEEKWKVAHYEKMIEEIRDLLNDPDYSKKGIVESVRQVIAERVAERDSYRACLQDITLSAPHVRDEELVGRAGKIAAEAVTDRNRLLELSEVLGAPRVIDHRLVKLAGQVAAKAIKADHDACFNGSTVLEDTKRKLAVLLGTVAGVAEVVGAPDTCDSELVVVVRQVVADRDNYKSTIEANKVLVADGKMIEVASEIVAERNRFKDTVAGVAEVVGTPDTCDGKLVEVVRRVVTDRNGYRDVFDALLKERDALKSQVDLLTSETLSSENEKLRKELELTKSFSHAKEAQIAKLEKNLKELSGRYNDDTRDLSNQITSAICTLSPFGRRDLTNNNIADAANTIMRERSVLIDTVSEISRELRIKLSAGPNYGHEIVDAIKVMKQKWNDSFFNS